jgi:tRNA (guanine37-N1)-methyltransferase
MRFSILTIFPSLVDSALKEGVVGRARDTGIIFVELLNLRDFTKDRHRTTDDRPFGGGEGMVMTPEPLSLAVQHARSSARPQQRGRVVLLSPQGRQLSQSVVEDLGREEHLILVCGRYEGVDERFRLLYVDDEISIGDFILSGGELPALVVIDAVTRLMPGVLGCSSSAANDSFSRSLLKHPQYTRPRVFEGLEVPDELLSGDHQKIEEYRFIASVRRTLEKRPDLLQKESFSAAEQKLLLKHGIDRGTIAGSAARGR